MGLVLLLLPESHGEDKMTVLASVLNHGDLCVGIFGAALQALSRTRTNFQRHAKERRVPFR